MSINELFDNTASTTKGSMDAALAYAARGWEVFPAPPGTKRSYKSAEHSNGAPWGKTRDPEQIRRDWRKWPDANVGIATGIDSGIFVLDVDTPEGHDVDGFASLQKLEDEHGKLPDTLMGESPSRSRHFVFNHPGGDVYIKCSASEIAPGLDVKGDGGMVIAPPSVKPKRGRYRWINEGTPIADAPDWLLELVKRKDVTASKAGTARPPRLPRPVQLIPVPPWLAAAIAESTGRGVSTDPQDLPLPTDPAKIDAALNAIERNNYVGIGHDDWIAIGGGLLKELGEAKAHEVFLRWSARGSDYNSDNFEQQWGSIVRKDGYGWTIGTLFYLASLADADWWRKYQLNSAFEVARLDTAVEVVRLDDAVEVVS